MAFADHIAKTRAEAHHTLDLNYIIYIYIIIYSAFVSPKWLQTNSRAVFLLEALRLPFHIFRTVGHLPNSTMAENWRNRTSERVAGRHFAAQASVFRVREEFPDSGFV